MKKHPVDELFKNKLSDLEIKPSATAWAKLKISGEEKTRQPVIWYAAAAIAIFLLSGGIIWSAMQQSGRSRERPVAAITRPAQHQQIANVDPELRMRPIEPAVKPDLAAVRSKKSEMKLNDVHSEKKTERTILPAAIDAVKNIESLTPEFRNPEIALNTKPAEIRMEAVTAAPAKDRIIVVSVEPAVEEAESGNKPGRFAKVFRQLKNARAGEKVDWEEVGFNPKNVMARFDDRLKHGEQEVSNRYQEIKEKTKL